MTEGPLSLIIHCSPPTRLPLAEVPLFEMVQAMKMGTLLPQVISFRKNRAVPAIQMELKFGKNSPYLISGFPRSFHSSDICMESSGNSEQLGDRQYQQHIHWSSPSSEHSSSLRWSRDTTDWKPPRMLDRFPHIHLGHYADRTRTLGRRRQADSSDSGSDNENGSGDDGADGVRGH